MAPDRLLRPRPDARTWVLGGILLAGVASFLHLGLGAADLWPRSSGWTLARDFVVRAVSPAFAHEGAPIEGRPGILPEAFTALGRTVLLAGVAMGLALAAGLVLGFLASSSWWADEPAGGRTRLGRVLRRAVLPTVWFATRGLIALLRSIHELLWAVLFLVSIGLTDTSAVLALALPYTGILAKIFSEMVDEAPRGPAHALRGIGAGGVQTYLFALVPQALPDMLAYTFYRFECALRSSAVLGFFGIKTIGYLIKQSFSSTYYGEVWTYLYVLIATILVFDAWSGAVRRRLVA
jgi:phosphonate transport system permease protein